MPNLLAISYIIAIILGLIALIDLWKLGVLATVNIPYVIGMIIVLFTLRCLWTVFDKAGKASWAAIIPVYNCVVLCQIAGYSGLQGIAGGLSGFSLSRLLMSLPFFVSVRVWLSISGGAHVLEYTCSCFFPSFSPYWPLARKYNTTMM